MNNNPENLNPREADIIEYLQEYCDGIGHAISNDSLAIKFSVDKRTMRDLIAHLITDHHVPLGSCSKNHSGIYYCVTDSDYETAHKELISRIKKLSRRAKGLRIGYFSKEKQLTLI